MARQGAIKRAACTCIKGAGRMIKAEFSEKAATREGYGHALKELGEKRRDIVALDADLAQSTKSIELSKAAPENFFYMGICEQNMIGTAAGLALDGKTVFASTFSIFIERAIEIIRQAVCYSNIPVKIVG